MLDSRDYGKRRETGDKKRRGRGEFRDMSRVEESVVHIAGEKPISLSP